MLKLVRKRFCKGDTLVEVMFAMGVFGLAAVGAISLMNRGLASAQNNLEISMARQEIDTQAEILRFLHNSYILTKDELSEEPCKDPKSYRDIWKCITTNYTYPRDEKRKNEWVTSATGGNDPDFYTRTTLAGETCDELYRLRGGESFAVPTKSFILNPRRLGSAELDATDLKKIITESNIISTSGTYPRLLFKDDDPDFMSDATVKDYAVVVNNDTKKKINRAEGIWVTGIQSQSGVECTKEDSNELEFRPDYYDFHINTCWDAIAGKTASTINTTIRLFNPDQVQPVNKSAELSLDSMGLFFVMTWKGPNVDIDAHLSGTTDREVGGRPFEVSYMNPTAGEERQYSFTNVPVPTFQLDVDAVDDKNYDSKQDKNCGSHCGDGSIEIIAIRGLFPGTFEYWLEDYPLNGYYQGFGGNNIKVRVFVGQADSGIGKWPRETDPIATFTYNSASGTKLNVAKFDVQQDGSFVINGKTITLSQSSFGGVKVESSCKRTSYDGVTINEQH